MVNYTKLLIDSLLQNAVKVFNENGESHFLRDAVGCQNNSADIENTIVDIAGRIIGYGFRNVSGEGCLDSVFNTLNTISAEKYGYNAHELDKTANYPLLEKCITNSSEYFKKADAAIAKWVSENEILLKTANELLGIMEKYLSYIPKSGDVSLYDDAKMTAALALCIANNVETARLDFDYFMENKSFLMFSCDFSGIQKFIYNIKSDRALKSLRSRSFYLELFLENAIDELLASVGLCRANLIYSGGGHAYILMPNTEHVKSAAEKYFDKINKKLIDKYDVSLYLAYAFCECSGSDLNNIPAEEEPYKNIFRTLSRKLSAKKLSRYNAESVRMLNRSTDGEKRECGICGRYENLKDGVCVTCRTFADISNDILNKEYIAVSEIAPSDKAYFTMPSVDGENYVYMCGLDECGGAKRVYAKNNLSSTAGTTALFVGDYVGDTSLELKNYAKNSCGIERIGVVRADVDNLGSAFVSGFSHSGSENAENLLRTASFSRQLSLFFKYHINSILEGEVPGGQFSLNGSNEKKRKNVVIVYSGGDDVFLIGSWNEALEAAVDIQKAFAKFTMNKLTLSAGVCLFDASYPVYKAAYDTGDMEELSKQADGKNSVSLFGEPGQENHTYKWSEFTDKVVYEKLSVIREYFEYVSLDDESGQNEKRGKAFIYKIIELIRNAGEKINIARIAYMLSRLAPGRNSAMYNKYKDFSEKMYGWVLNEKDRKQLLTALYIFIYLTRERG